MSSRAITFAGFALIGVGALAWAVITAVRPRLASPRAVVGALVASVPARVIALVAWAWIGWHLFVRTNVFD